MRVVILHSTITENAGPDEQDTLVQVDFIRNILEKAECEVILLPFTLELLQLSTRLQKYQPTLIFNLVESVLGRNEFIHIPPLLFNQLNIPYTGNDANVIFISSDKCLAKRLLQAENIPTPPWLEPKELMSSAFPNDGPYFVKSVLEDGSLGLNQNSLVNNKETLVAVASNCQSQFGGKWFAERFIAGREFNISLLAGPNGPEVLPIAEIDFRNLPVGKLPIVDYAAKWHDDSVESQNTPRRFDFTGKDHSLLNTLADLSLRCWQAFKMTGYARVDVRVDENNQPWVLEVNANPCLTPDAGFMAAAAEADLDNTTVIKRIIEAAL